MRESGIVASTRTPERMTSSLKRALHSASCSCGRSAPASPRCRSNTRCGIITVKRPSPDGVMSVKAMRTAGPSRITSFFRSLPEMADGIGNFIESARTPDPLSAFAVASKTTEASSSSIEVRARSIGVTGISGSPPKSALTRRAIAPASAISISASGEVADAATTSASFSTSARRASAMRLKATDSTSISIG